MRNPQPNQIDTNNDATGENTYQWTFTATVEVSDLWVRDGFDLTPERLQRIIEEGLTYALPYANSRELKVTSDVTQAPDQESIRKEMGY